MYFKRHLAILLLGFSSGLPLYVTLDLLKAWLSDVGTSLSVIGAANILGLPLNLKFIWAPFVDRYTLFSIGRRRSWMLTAQILLFVSIFSMSFFDPRSELYSLYILGFCVNFFMATQDIAIDAYRRDLVPDSELGTANSLATAGYRLGMLCSGAFALFLADTIEWQTIYRLVACFMLVGFVTTLFIPEPETSKNAPRTLLSAVVEPFKDFITRPRVLLVLLMIVTYKLGENFAAAMFIPFYKQIGFTWSEVASIVKTYGLVMVIAGGLAGAPLLSRLSMYKALFWLGLLQSMAIMGFYALAILSQTASFPEYQFLYLSIVIGLENFSIGLGTSAFVAMMSLFCDRRFSGTQYALLSSIAALPRTLFSSYSGQVAAWAGWPAYFSLCTLFALLSLFLVIKLEKTFSR